MSGMKDFVSFKQLDGKRVHIKKRLILSNLQELFKNFKEKHPAASIGFSKFAELWPKHCILAGASGTHFVCVCTIHQNIKLMLHTFKLPSPFTTYQECLAWLMCNPATPGCHLVTLLLGNGVRASSLLQKDQQIHRQAEKQFQELIFQRLSTVCKQCSESSCHLEDS